jgi:thiosulfate dehydrogenase
MDKKQFDRFFQTMHFIYFAILVLIVFMLFFYFFGNPKTKLEAKVEITKKEFSKIKKPWQPIGIDAALYEKDPGLIKYGLDLIANTAKYLGPKGSIAHQSNGMNCQNCHLEAGAKIWGNNYAGVAPTYPKFRERSGTKETIVKRVNDCIERSLNGKALDSTSHEMRAMVAYIAFLGKFVPKDSIPEGTGLWKLKFMKRAADPLKGQLAYEQKCVTCHAKNGQGIKHQNGVSYTYPPLWGEHSYNTGAGLYRLSRFAGYIKTNMPLGATYEKPQLTDEEAWDIAAYVNSRPRPAKDLSKDWPKITGKPVDHPFGPYADNFSEEQHKYGPFKPIDDFKKATKK